MTISGFDAVNILLGLFSLSLAVVSIYLALYFYTKSKEAELQAAKLLSGIDVQVGLMQKITAKMLDKFVTHATAADPLDNLTRIAAAITGNNANLIPESTGSARPTQVLVTAYIATMYWSAIANAALQERLPEDIAKLDEPDYAGMKELLRMSKADYFAAKSWLDQNGRELIPTSLAATYYEQFQSSPPDPIMREAAEVYAYRAQQSRATD